MKLPVLSRHITTSQKSADKAYLLFQIAPNIPALLPMEETQEALVVSAERLTVVPNMPACVLGLLNQRSRVFWIIDLPELLGFDSLDHNLQQYSIIIVQVDNSPLGLAVPEIKGVSRFPTESLQSPVGTVSPSLTSYLRGCIPQENEILLVLDPEAIVHSDVLSLHQ